MTRKLDQAAPKTDLFFRKWMGRIGSFDVKDVSILVSNNNKTNEMKYIV